jgi:hypothetical protein
VAYIARYVGFVECMPRNTYCHWLGTLVCRRCGVEGGGEGTMDVQNKTPYNCCRKQIYSQTEHFNATAQCDNVSVHQNHHQAHLLQNFKINFCDKCAWWWFWWNETRRTLLYVIVLCLTVYGLCISFTVNKTGWIWIKLPILCLCSGLFYILFSVRSIFEVMQKAVKVYS